MGFNKGTSTYHCVQGLYWRDAEGKLLAVEGSNSNILPDIWEQIWEEIRAEDGSWTEEDLPCGQRVKTLPIQCKDPLIKKIRSNFPPQNAEEELVTKVAEITHTNGNVLGMLSSRPKSLADDAFCTFTEHFILTETEFEPFATLSEESDPEHVKIVEEVTSIFERTIKNLSRDDKWDFGGREIFMNRVYGYVQQDRAIQHALPAFPCKSPNPNKVGGTMPDLAEHIALEVLRNYIKDVNKVYKHGATMWVISDGIVFSDCIGVDDKMIDTYDEALVEIYKKKYPVEEGPVPAIKFKGLKHIFMEKPSTLAGLKESWLKGVEMPHPVKTEIDNDVENCRKLMLAVGGASRKFIRQCITEQEEHAISLYRGQTRFMLEDLADVPAVKALSNKQKKKTAALVAEEMMSRNQGYSNLTELLLTNYVRLSIHAHDNSGPKFAVRLLPKTMVRPIQDLEKRHEPVAAYEFQLPTPWHNTIIKVEGDEYLYLARSEIAKKALAGTDYEGSWVEDAPEGAHFLLTRKPAALAKRPTLALVTKQGVNHVRQKVKAMRSPSTKTPVSPKPLSRTKTMPLFSPMSSEPVAWVTPVEKPAHPFTPLAERRVKTIFMAADEKAKNAPVPLGKRGRSATMSPAKPTASSSTGKINLMPLPDKLKLKFGDKPKAPEPTPEPRSAVEKPSVATVMEEEEPVTPPNEPANAPSAPTVAPAPTPAATQEPKTTPAAATPAAEDPKPSSPSEIQTVSPTPAAAQQQSTLAVPASPTSSATATANGTPVDTTAPKKRTSFLSFFAEKPVVTATVSEKQAEAETQSVRRTGFLRIQTSSRSPFATFMKRVGLVQSPA